MVELVSDPCRPQSVPIACSSTRNDALRGLEQFLGDPNDPTRPFSFSRSLVCDEEEDYPQSAEDAPPKLGSR